VGKCGSQGSDSKLESFPMMSNDEKEPGKNKEKKPEH
jgi:hypothetical protein